MLSLWFIIACNTPEPTEVPALPETITKPVTKTAESPSKDLALPQQTKATNDTSVEGTKPYFSEVMQVPLKVAKFRGEWIELYNPTDTAIDLSTYSIHSKDDTGITFTSEHTIEPKSAFLLAVRKSPSGNGGLPSVDYVYKHEVLKVMATDWIELRNGDEVVDRWEFTREELKKGYSFQRNADGTTCHATETYGEGDYGSPKKLTVCK